MPICFYFKQQLLIFLVNLVLFFLFVFVVLSPRCSFYITSRTTCTAMQVILVVLPFDCLWFKCNLLLLCGDVELYPGPKQITAKKFSICHWNLNRIVANNFAKLALLNANNSIHKFDIICY